jgi:hypothetical protein
MKPAPPVTKTFMRHLDKKDYFNFNYVRYFLLSSSAFSNMSIAS